MNRLAKGIELTPTANTYISKKKEMGKKKKKEVRTGQEREREKKKGKEI